MESVGCCKAQLCEDGLNEVGGRLLDFPRLSKLLLDAVFDTQTPDRQL